MAKVSAQIYNLHFSEYPDLEIKCKGTSIAKLQWLQSLNVNVNKPEDAMYPAFDYIVSRVVSWNLEHPDIEDDEDKNDDGTCVHCGLHPDSGEPLPLVRQSLMCQGMSFFGRFVFGYMFAVARVSVPKEMSLNDGAPNIQEEVMSRLAAMQNQSTLPMQNSS